VGKGGDALWDEGEKNPALGTDASRTRGHSRGIGDVGKIKGGNNWAEWGAERCVKKGRRRSKSKEKYSNQ